MSVEPTKPARKMASAVATFSEEGATTAVTSPPVDILDGDGIVAIFICLYTHHKPFDAICFLKTCKKVNAPFKVIELGTRPYQECKGRYMTRMPVSMSDDWPYSVQLAREETSKRQAAGFFKACEMLAMHCATECCSCARDEYNRYYAQKFAKIKCVTTGVRLLSVCSEKDVVFTYGSERDKSSTSGRKPTHYSRIRKLSHDDRDGHADNKLNTTCFKVQGMFPSPDGCFLAFTSIREGRVRVYAWDTSEIIENPQVRELGVLANDAAKKVIEYRHVQFLWWARRPDGKHTLLAAYSAHYYDDFGLHMYRADANLTKNDETTVHVVEYGTTPGVDHPKLVHSVSVKNSRSTPSDPVQHIGMMHAIGPDLAVFYKACHHQGIDLYDVGATGECFNVTIIDTMGARMPVHVRTYSPHKIFPPPTIHDDLETVSSPKAIALSPAGTHLAILAEHFKWRRYDVQKELCLVVYTFNETTTDFVRMRGPEDEITIAIGPTQEANGWEVLFSPCGAYIAVVYGRNRFGTKAHDPTTTLANADPPDNFCHVAQSAVRIVHIGPKGLKQSQLIDCPDIRQIAWSRHAMVVMPKHGAVKLV